MRTSTATHTATHTVHVYKHTCVRALHSIRTYVYEHTSVWPLNIFSIHMYDSFHWKWDIPKSTKSRNSDSSVFRGTNSKWDFYLIWNFTEEFEILDLMDFGGSAYSLESVIWARTVQNCILLAHRCVSMWAHLYCHPCVNQYIHIFMYLYI